MKIQILSDLHNEFLRSGQSNSSHHWSGVIPKTDADIIILAGDIDTGINGAQWTIDESARYLNLLSMYLVIMSFIDMNTEN